MPLLPGELCQPLTFLEWESMLEPPQSLLQSLALQSLALLECQPTRSQGKALLKPLELLECQPTRSQGQALLQLHTFQSNPDPHAR